MVQVVWPVMAGGRSLQRGRRSLLRPAMPAGLARSAANKP